MRSKFDVIWIGTGQATLTVVPKLAAAGKTVAVIEGGKFGGTCVNFGCTPTKTLVASAYAVHMAGRGKDFGFSTNSLEVDFSAVMAPQVANREATSSWIENHLSTLDGCTVFRGYGRFVDEHTVEVAGRRLSAENIVVHTGTRPRSPEVAGAESIEWLTNESLLDLNELPTRLLIVGGSYIALEFAQIFRRLGSQVTVLTRGPSLLSKEDADISALVEEILVDEGVEMIHNCQIEQVSPRDGVTADLSVDGQPVRRVGSHLLFAIGRVPNTDRLNVDAAGLAVDDAGYLTVNDVGQTSVPNIYALGDVNGRGAFTHTAVNDGEVFWDHYRRVAGANGDDPGLDRSIGERPFISSMFTDPPLARVGLNETQARLSGKKTLMATMPMSRIARAREKRETSGLVKILVDASTEQFLGATILGTGGDEVIGAFAVAMITGASYQTFRRIVFPHPTVSELMPWCLDNLQPLS
ncbi:MAG: mercuric reductase [Planctomycetota bacterium]